MTPRIRRLALRVALPVAGVLLLTVAVLAGWTSSVREWEIATGWNEIPIEDRPRLADDFPARIRWLGHSGFLIEWRQTRLLLDPNTSAWCTLSRRTLEQPIDIATLGPVDAVLISHAHYDHLDLRTLRGLSHIGSLVVPAGSERHFRDPEWAESALLPLRVGQSTRVGALEIVAVAAAHNGNRLHPFASRQGAQGYVIRAGDEALYFAGDTGAGNDFEGIRRAYRPRLAILPIGAYLPRIPMKYYHLSPEEAVDVAIRLGVEWVVPCHFGTFGLALDRPSWALPRFAHEAHRRGVRWRMPQLIEARR